ncbi:hypothetical protein ACFQ8C_12295, partial [Streptomyces sp. NPDC056503]
RVILVENPSTRSFAVAQARPTRGHHRQLGKSSVLVSPTTGMGRAASSGIPGPDDDADTPESWNEGRSRLLIEWGDGTGNGVIGLEDFLAAAGLALAPGASVS